MYSILLVVILCLMTVSRVASLSISRGPQQSRIITHHSQWRLAASKEDEIRALEEKLQRLKEEAVEEEETAVVVEEEENVVTLNDQAVYTELLTEQWKEDEVASEGGGALKSVATAFAVIGVLVGLALFSQVPVGQEDLSRYSVTPTTTNRQIDLGDLNRARQGGDI